MKILYVCHRVPYPPRRGGKIRPFNMISHLSRTHEVTVASIARSQGELEESRGLSEHCQEVMCEVIGASSATLRMAGALPTGRPFSMAYFHSPALARRIRESIARQGFDLIFVHCSSVAQYVNETKGIRKILDFGDMDSRKWNIYGRLRPFPMSLIYRMEAAKLEAQERKLATQFDMCTCTTMAELETLRGYETGARTDWFPNGVDHQYFAPADEPHDPDLISFVGRMDYYPNQESMYRFCHETLPLIHAQRPAARLVIIGADPPRHMRALADLPGVSVTGSVPDVRPYILRSAVNVAPLTIARGTQNKILEVMAMGVPVVTSEAAARGVDAEPGKHLLVATGPRAEADAVLSLLEDAAMRTRFGQSGRERILSHHDWARSMTRLDGIIERCMTEGQHGTGGSYGES